MLRTCTQTSRAFETDAMHLHSYKRGIWNRCDAPAFRQAGYMEPEGHIYTCPKYLYTIALSALSAEDAAAAQSGNAVKQAWLLCSLNDSIAYIGC